MSEKYEPDLPKPVPLLRHVRVVVAGKNHVSGQSSRAA